MNLAIRRLGLAATLTVAAPVMVCAQPQLKVEGTEFVLTMAGGSVLRSADLVGATLRLRAGGEDVEVTIKSVREDREAVGGRVVLHHFVVRDRGGGQVDLCDPDADGRSLGFPIPNGRGGFDLTCTSGAVGKCVRWGYRPWEERPGGPPLQALHQACVHMARADYGGDGRGTTRDGTMIFFCDRFGIHACEQGALMAFEAGWGTDGATCVAVRASAKTSRWSNWPSAILGSSRAWAVPPAPKRAPRMTPRRCCSTARKNDKPARAPRLGFRRLGGVP
jgi:hypothetical protein